MSWWVFILLAVLWAVSLFIGLAVNAKIGIAIQAAAFVVALVIILIGFS